MRLLVKVNMQVVISRRTLLLGYKEAIQSQTEWTLKMLSADTMMIKSLEMILPIILKEGMAMTLLVVVEAMILLKVEMAMMSLKVEMAMMSLKVG